jgi:hypothetical protein
MARDVLEDILQMEKLQAASQVQRTSFTLAELAQSRAGYLTYKSSRRMEHASYVIAILTAILIVLTVVLILRQ